MLCLYIARCMEVANYTKGVQIQRASSRSHLTGDSCVVYLKAPNGLLSLTFIVHKLMQLNTQPYGTYTHKVSNQHLAMLSWLVYSCSSSVCCISPPSCYKGSAAVHILEPYGLILWPDLCSVVTAVKCMATCQHLNCGLTIALMFLFQF